MLNIEEKITILNEFSDKDINIKNEFGEGLIMSVLNMDNNILFDYLLDRNIDLDYYTIIKLNNPFYHILLIYEYAYGRRKIGIVPIGHDKELRKSV